MWAGLEKGSKIGNGTGNRNIQYHIIIINKLKQNINFNFINFYAL